MMRSKEELSPKRRNPRATSQRSQLTGIFASIAILAAPLQGLAQDDGVYQSGAERIDLSDRIRVNSQRIAAAVCLVDADIDVAANQQIITNTITETDILLQSLKDGNAHMGVPIAEDGRKMLASIRGVSLQWDPFKAEAQTRTGQGQPAPGPDYVSRQNLNLMHVSKNLTSQVINDYTIPPALLHIDASTISFAARQRSLSQQIAKEACGLLTGNTIMGSPARLENAVAKFDATFQALLNGFPAAGVSAPANADIRSGLEAATREWNNVKTEFASVVAGTSSAQPGTIINRLDTVLDKIDAVIPHYVEQSKSGI